MNSEPSFGRPDEPEFLDPDSTLQEDGDGRASMVRREERVRTDVQRVPYERVLIRRKIVTEQVTRVVEVRREEIEIEHLPLSHGAPDPVGTEVRPGEPIELILSEEEVELTTRVVARERVRVLVEALAVGEETVSMDLRREEIAVESVGSLQKLDSPGDFDDPRGD